MNSSSSQGAQTADRAMQVLLLVAHSEEPLGVAEIARRLGFNVSSTYRLVQALAGHSLLARERDRSYGVGGGLVALAATVMQRVDLPERALPAMERLRALTSETVSVYVRDGRHRICVALLEGLHPMRWVVPVGDRQPLNVGLTGKVILAFLPEDEVTEVLDSAEPGVIDRGHVEEQIGQARATGYLVGVGDRVPGVGGVSAPIFDRSGVAAALTVSGPADRLTAEVGEQVAAAVLEEAAGISRALGAQAKIAVGAVR